MRVVIAEDHYLVREGTRRLLESSEDVQVVAAVGDGDALVEAVERLSPDAAVVDIRMPPTHKKEGIEAALRIRRDHPDIGILVLSQHADSLYAFELFQAGTAGLAYLLKDRVGDLEELIRALRAVTAGDSVIDPVVVEGLLARRSRLSNSEVRWLTDREKEVLREMAQGKSNAAIADALFVSQSAVEKHINSIFAKLSLSPGDADVHRRVSAVLAYLRTSSEESG
jgi:DNA-binding NarL/FixJ family response regulator